MKENYTFNISQLEDYLKRILDFRPDAIGLDLDLAKLEFDSVLETQLLAICKLNNLTHVN